MPHATQILISPRASERATAAREWLARIAPATPALVLAANQEAADDLLRGLAAKRGALFAIDRLTLNRLAGLLAATYMAENGLAPAAGLAGEAVAARTVFRMKGDPCLGYFEPVLERPGFPGALARTLAELRMAGVTTTDLQALDSRGAALAALLERFEAELRESRLLDRAGILTAATAALASATASRFVGIPILLFDLAIESAAERDFIAALSARAEQTMATLPAGESRTHRLITAALGANQNSGSPPAAPADYTTSLARLQQYLFGDKLPPQASLDDSVTLRSAAGEMQECVEIARRIQAEAKRGITFDRIAVLLHAPVRYAPYLEEALHRAGIPAWFARGTTRPEPGGRAMLALLNCASERFSARRFAEYLSLAQVPDTVAEARAAAAPFVATAADLAASALRTDLELPPLTPEAEPPGADPLPVVEGTVRAPWRWERLLVDAAVVGGRDRWQKRLDGLAEELRMRRAELTDNGEAQVAAVDRRLLDLEHLRAAALPIIGALASMPREAAWAEWLAHLRNLAALAIRDSDPVLAALAELEPMGPVGPIGLDEVRIVLAERLGRLEARPARRRYGAVFVAPTSHVRGLEFDVVIVPGLAERVFPKKLTEDPILPDALRSRLSPDLTLQRERVAAERLALRIAAGAATKRIMFSYPRVDLDQARPRVPSFYALEILRAAEGRLPGFDELARRAAGDRVTRLGWPVPESPTDAIDDIEFDLAVLDRLIDADPEATTGAAHYLLDTKTNLHLGRALRARARRWLRRWTPDDGLVDPNSTALAALARHRLDARSYSPTALQNFAACPYRFYLQAILRLEPRDEIEAIEVIDPLTRGALFHEVQFEVLTALRGAGALPVTAANLEAAYAALETALEAVAARRHDELAPAIERVWLDGIDSIRADLREWMRRMAEDKGRFRPERFELAFGLTDRPQADPASVAAPVALASGISLRGSIDLIERGPDGRLRATDHKTGRVRAAKDLVIGGGKTLQPVLYALAAERILEESVECGRLYYCTAAGGYEERSAALDANARDSIARFAHTLRDALERGFLPAAPDDGECEYCDYRRVCGPYEETRVRRKSEADGVRARLKDLADLRKMK
jgi:ATP-dependent helicase/nuclease subunit B